MNDAFLSPATNACPPPPAPPPTRRWGGCLLGLFSGCLLSALAPVALFAGLVALALRSGGDLSARMGDALRGEGAGYEQLRGEGEGEGARQVLRLSLNGVITGAAPSRWYLPPDCDAAVLEEIEAAIDDPSFDALLLEVDSPGGGVTASDAIYHALERFKAAKEGRKVIVLGGDVVASGAYYLAMQADWIRLRPTSLVGSIGVIVPGFNAAALAQRLGIADNSIASGASKDLGNPLKPINPEHNAILQTVVDDMYARFVAIVAKGRRMTEADVRKLADGRIFSATDALNLRLIDDIGYEDTLDAEIARLLGCDEAALAIYQPLRKGNAFRAFLSDFPSALGRGLAAPLAEPPTRAPEYRW